MITQIKLVVAGSRDFSNYKLLTDNIDNIRQHYEVVEIVSGTARGADTLGEIYARANNIPIKKFPADWNRYGRSAGYIRNKQMAIYADAVVVFWNGTSKGTQHMINLTKEYHKKLRVVVYE